MKISIIGSGNAATVLGRLLIQAGFIIEEIVSKNKMHALQLAKELNASAVEHISGISKNSDVYIIAVTDDAIKLVGNELYVGDKIVVHTCGSVSINILQNTSNNYGVLYPLQSLHKEIDYKPAIPFLIDANNEETKNAIIKLAASISKNVIVANDEQRMQYHLSAIIVSNFTNHLFALTKEYCLANSIEFSLLFPLIEETVKRLHNYEPGETQTGPAVRNDQSTIQKHLMLLKDYPQMQTVYEMMSNSIIQSKKQ